MANDGEESFADVNVLLMRNESKKPGIIAQGLSAS